MVLWYGAALLVIVLVLSSCMTPKKAVDYLKKKDLLADTCAANFPVQDTTIVKDSIHFDTLYLELEPEILRDSFFIMGDTIVREITKKCPEIKTIVKTIKHDSIIIRRDRAFEAVQDKALRSSQIENQKLTADKEKLQGKVTKKNKIIWWLILVVAGLTLYTFRKPLIAFISRGLFRIPPV